MEVVVITYRLTLEPSDEEEIIGVALNMDIAKEYAEDLKIKYPYAYGDDFGVFSFEEYKVIDD